MICVDCSQDVCERCRRCHKEFCDARWICPNDPVDGGAEKQMDEFKKVFEALTK